MKMATSVDHDKPDRTDEPDAKKPKVTAAQLATERMTDEETTSAAEINETSKKVEKLRLPQEDSVEMTEKVENGQTSAVASMSTTCSSDEAEEQPAPEMRETPRAEGTPTATTGFGGFSAESTSKPTTSGFGGFSAFKGFASFADSASHGFASFAAKAGDKPTGFLTKATEEEGFSQKAEPSEDDNKPAAHVASQLTEAELANGEEEELILVEKRAKMYKLIDKDYAEVGVGPIRVLQPKDATDKSDIKARARIVMRRESYPRGPGTKLILNTRVSACIACIKKTEKSLLLIVAEKKVKASLDDESTEDASAPEASTEVKEAPTSTESSSEAELTPTTYLIRFGLPEDLPPVQENIHALLPVLQSTVSDK